MPTNAVRMIAVHFANRSGRGKAAQFVREEVAQDMVDARLAVWNKKQTYINLTKSEAGLTPTARSLKPGLSVMQGYVEGDVQDQPASLKLEIAPIS